MWRLCGAILCRLCGSIAVWSMPVVGMSFRLNWTTGSAPPCSLDTACLTLSPARLLKRVAWFYPLLTFPQLVFQKLRSTLAKKTPPKHTNVWLLWAMWPDGTSIKFLLPLSQLGCDVNITSGQMFSFLTHLLCNAMMHIQQPKGCWNIPVICAYRHITGITGWIIRLCTSSSCRMQSEWVCVYGCSAGLVENYTTCFTLIEIPIRLDSWVV